MMTCQRGFVVLLVGLGLLACTQQSQQPQPPTSVATATGQSAAVDETRWHILYTRPGWNGGPTVDLRAVGDVMLGRGVARAAEERGYTYPFAQVTELLDGDLTLGNLESPLTERRSPMRPGPYRMPAPLAFAEPLQNAGFDALSLANNHALDVGTAGLQDTVSALTAAQIAPLGVGADETAAYAPEIITVADLRIALLGFNDVTDPEDGAGDWASAAQSWGRAWLDDTALAAVRQARANADLVVVSVHWGREYVPQPLERQRSWADKLVDAGADLIIGAHPHVLQPAALHTADERIGFVAYSLGNFIFDQEFSLETSTSAVLRVLLDADGVALVAATPIEIAAGQARPLALQNADAHTILQALDSNLAQPTSPATPTVSMATPSLQPDQAGVVRPQRLPADLRGDGQPLWVTLDVQGLVQVRDGASADAPVVWQNEAADWRVTRIAVGDPNHDGRIEVMLLLWRPDADGVLHSHPFLVGWRGGQYRVIWGGSATPIPMQDFALDDLDGDGFEELVVQEGGHLPGDPVEAVSTWRWFGWGFESVGDDGR